MRSDICLDRYLNSTRDWNSYYQEHLSRQRSWEGAVAPFAKVSSMLKRADYSSRVVFIVGLLLLSEIGLTREYDGYLCQLTCN